jgi:hypothetical protein
MEAYVHGVSTRKVDDLVAALGLEAGISKSEVSRICGELDEPLEAFRTRPLGHVEFPYVFCDATYVKARTSGRVVSKAIVVATGVTRTGDREVLGCAVGDSEDGAFWLAFLRSLRARGLTGVQLVISDAHEGLVSAIEAVMIGAAWQRCRVHFMRNVLAKVPKASAEMVAAAIRTIFSQPDATHVQAQFDEITTMLEAKFPVADMLTDARADLLAQPARQSSPSHTSGPPGPYGANERSTAKTSARMSTSRPTVARRARLSHHPWRGLDGWRQGARRVGTARPRVARLRGGRDQLSPRARTPVYRCRPRSAGAGARRRRTRAALVRGGGNSTTLAPSLSGETP